MPASCRLCARRRSAQIGRPADKVKHSTAHPVTEKALWTAKTKASRRREAARMSVACASWWQVNKLGRDRVVAQAGPGVKRSLVTLTRKAAALLLACPLRCGSRLKIRLHPGAPGVAPASDLIALRQNAQPDPNWWGNRMRRRARRCLLRSHPRCRCTSARPSTWRRSRR